MVPPHAASTETWGGQVGRIRDIRRLAPLSFGSAVTATVYADVASGSVILSRAAYSRRIIVTVNGVVVVASSMAPMSPPRRTAP